MKLKRIKNIKAGLYVRVGVNYCGQTHLQIIKITGVPKKDSYLKDSFIVNTPHKYNHRETSFVADLCIYAYLFKYSAKLKQYFTTLLDNPIKLKEILTGEKIAPVKQIMEWKNQCELDNMFWTTIYDMIEEDYYQQKDY